MATVIFTVVDLKFNAIEEAVIWYKLEKKRVKSWWTSVKHHKRWYTEEKKRRMACENRDLFLSQKHSEILIAFKTLFSFKFY